MVGCPDVEGFGTLVFAAGTPLTGGPDAERMGTLALEAGCCGGTPSVAGGFEAVGRG